MNRTNIVVATIVIFLLAAISYAAVSYTANYNLAKPDAGTPNWAPYMNTNADKVDAALKKHDDSLAVKASVAQIAAQVTAATAAKWDSSTTKNFVRKEISDSLTTKFGRYWDSTTVKTKVSKLISDSLANVWDSTQVINKIVSALNDSLGQYADTTYVKSIATNIADSVRFETLLGNGDIGTGAGQLVEATDVARLTGAQTIAGVKSLSSFPQKTGVGASLNPIAPAEFTTKYYVDAQVVATTASYSILNGTGSIGFGAAQVPNGAATLTAISDSVIARQGRGPIRTITTSATLSLTDFSIVADATSGALGITLPATATCYGRIYQIKKIDNAFNVTITPPTGNIDGAGLKILSAQYSSVTIHCDGTNWWIF